MLFWFLQYRAYFEWNRFNCKQKPVEQIFQRLDEILSEVLDGILENAGDEIFVCKMGVAVALSIVLLKGTG